MEIAEIYLEILHLLDYCNSHVNNKLDLHMLMLMNLSETLSLFLQNKIFPSEIKVKHKI